MFRKSMNLIHSFETSTSRYPKKSENDVGNTATYFYIAKQKKILKRIVDADIQNRVGKVVMSEPFVTRQVRFVGFEAQVQAQNQKVEIVTNPKSRS